MPEARLQRTRAAYDQEPIHVRFTESETMFRLRYPLQRDDFAGDRWFDGKRWRPMTTKKRRELQER